MPHFVATLKTIGVFQSPFKRQLSLRLNDLPSNLERTRSMSLDNNAANNTNDIVATTNNNNQPPPGKSTHCKTSSFLLLSSLCLYFFHILLRISKGSYAYGGPTLHIERYPALGIDCNLLWYDGDYCKGSITFHNSLFWFFLLFLLYQLPYVELVCFIVYLVPFS